MKKSILVLGSRGFIGKNIVESYKSIYNVCSPTRKELNLLDTDNVYRYLKKNAFDTVIHCATHNATVTSNNYDQHVLLDNLRMFFNLARADQYYNRMLYFGSGAEYGREYYIPRMKEQYFNEHVPTDEYGYSKYIMSLHASKSKKIFDLRLFGVFGKYEDWRIRFISNAICRSLMKEPITIQKNVQFDYLDISDLCSIVRKFIETKDIPYHDFNICRGLSVDLYFLAKLISSISKHKVPIYIKEKGKKKEYSGDNKRLKKFLYNFSFTSIEKSVLELYRWYSENIDIINRKELVAYT